MWGEDAGVDISLAQKAENYHNVKKEYLEKLQRVSSCVCGRWHWTIHFRAFFLQNPFDAVLFQDKQEKKLKKDANDRNKHKNKFMNVLSRK
jgi:hypothetical protein